MNSSRGAGALLASPADRRLALVGAVSVGLSVCVCVAQLVGFIPNGLAIIIVLITSGVAIRGALWFTKRSATSAGRARVSRIISDVGLCVAAVAVLASLPVVTRNGGFADFADSLFQHLWSLALLTALALPVRTLTWRAYAGAGLTGYLALTQLARLAGRPVVDALGHTVFPVAIFVPVTEELIKAIPVLVVVILAARRRQQRPSALDCALLGAWVGAGYAVYENSQYGRVGGSWSSPPVSWLFPSDAVGHSAGVTYFVAGHLVWSALVGLGLGVGVLYGRRFPLAWLAIPLTFVVAIAEHCESNSLTLVPFGPTPFLDRVLQVLTLDGLLSLLLLLAGLVTFLIVERRAVQPDGKPAGWLPLPAPIAFQRSSRLATLQLSPTRPELSPARPGHLSGSPS
jgi:RsiW-degrading membrane proteinase PrsW (M82 family)